MPLLDAAQATPPKRVRMPFQRSGLSARYIGSGLASISALFDATGLAAYVPADKAWMKDFIPRAFETVIADSARLPVANDAVANDDATVNRLRKMRFSLNGLRQIVIRELAPAAELVLGFNELDGD
jgi:predicted lipoprotein